MNNLPTYLLTYSSGDNSQKGSRIYRAENDFDARAIAHMRCPEGTTAVHVERLETTVVIATGAYPDALDHPIDPLAMSAADIAARFGPDNERQKFEAVK